MDRDDPPLLESGSVRLVLVHCADTDILQQQRLLRESSQWLLE